MIPKFRAWLKEKKRMVEVKSIHLSTKKIMYGYSINKQLYGNESVSFEDIELMQFTGLKDKNGNEIYEGDIVKYNDLKYEVYWNNEYCRYEIKEVGNPEYFANFLAKMGPKFEVVGNIYENNEFKERKGD